MRLRTLMMAAALAAGWAAQPALAGTMALEGTRSNISPGGSPFGRCAGALTISFAPDAFAASGHVAGLGDFTYTASHCIAGPPPGSYTDGLFEWVFDTGKLFGTYTGTLTAVLGSPGVFNVAESILFTGGTGQFLGASGFADAIGTLRFGAFNGGPASFGDVRFTGELTAAGVPEPATLGLLAAGFGLMALARRRRPSRASPISGA